MGIAASVGSEVILVLLIQSQARLDQLDAAGYTALHYAAYEGYRSVVEALLAAYVSRNQTDFVNIRDTEGRTALEMAKRSNNGKVVQVIQSFMTQHLPHYLISEEERLELETWLKETVQLPQYVDGFINNGFTRLSYWAARGISREEYQEIGVLLSGHRRMIDAYLKDYLYEKGELETKNTNANTSEADGDDSGNDSSSDSSSDSDTDSGLSDSEEE